MEEVEKKIQAVLIHVGGVAEELLEEDKLTHESKRLGEKIAKEEALFQKIPWIEEATCDRSFFYDPAISLEEDIQGAAGNTLFEKGTKINPLDHVTLGSGLLFFDGDNPEHVKWAERQKGEFKWILVGGNPIKLQEEKNRLVFFDQGGIYLRKFQIKKVPCRITQSEKELLVEEIAIPNEYLQKKK